MLSKPVMQASLVRPMKDLLNRQKGLHFLCKTSHLILGNVLVRLEASWPDSDVRRSDFSVNRPSPERAPGCQNA